MNLSSCRELKSEVLGRAHSARPKQEMRRAYRLERGEGELRLPRAARGGSRWVWTAPPIEAEEQRKALPQAQVQVMEASPVAAIGIAPIPSVRKQYKLALRVFKGEDRHVPKLMRGLTRFEKEIDLVTGVRYRPRLTVRAGGSCGHYRISAGTLGGFVEDNKNYYMLSNNHVFANSNWSYEGDPILQPGPADVVAATRVIGRLHRWFPLSLVDVGGVDAALAVFSEAVQSFEPWNYAGIGEIKNTAVKDRLSVARVVKRGRTTAVTHGTVSAFELDGVRIDYGEDWGIPAVVTFDDQIECVGIPPQRPFSQPGDSGSFIIDEDTMQPYALLYGGGEDDAGIDRTLAHFMPDVLTALQVRLVQ